MMEEFCVFVSDDLTDGDLIYRILEVHCKNGFIGHIRVSAQPARWHGTWPIWHYEVKDQRITLIGVGHDSIKFLKPDGSEYAHPTVADWPLKPMETAA
jgi:hypothetical protein